MLLCTSTKRKNRISVEIQTHVSDVGTATNNAKLVTDS